MSSRQGQLILAGPTLADPNFAETVTLLVQHGEEGALGLILNRPTQTPVALALEEGTEVSAACQYTGVVHRGGPCEGPLMVLHTREERGGVAIGDGVFFSVDADEVAWLLEYEQGPLKCFAGYAGWGPGQLEAEIEIGSWLLTHATRKLIFSPGDQQWIDLLRAINPTQAAIAQNPRLKPADPTLN